MIQIWGGTVAIRAPLYLEQIQEYILCIKNEGAGIRIKKWVEKKKKIESKTAYLRVTPDQDQTSEKKTNPTLEKNQDP